MSDEIERRKAVVAAQATDVDRWSQRESFAPQWAYRAGLAAQMIPAYAKVLDIGCGAMDLARMLPEGCEYQPCDLVARDERTIVCDLNAGEFPDGAQPDVVSMLGVLEYIREPLDLLRKVRALNCPLVCSYSITDRRPGLDRAGQGWINGFDFAALQALMGQAGFVLRCRQTIDPLQDVFKWEPGGPVASALAPPKKVLVLSYYNDANFGDRLGYHVINSLVPAGAIVTHASVKPWTVPDEPFDLLILGIGNSLNAATVMRPDLHALMEAVPHTLGVFGTTYRYQYRELIDPKLFETLLGRLTTWWARYEEDIAAFGRGRSNVRHLGDVLISAFPLATPTLDRNLVIPADFKLQDVPLDRTIQRIQAYRRVSSARIHPMLCALTSAEEVKYQEQSEDPRQSHSGKFRSQLYDIFGRSFEEDKYFTVDREAVIRYKLMVEANLVDLRAQIAKLLS
ncbi:class I SAM-dependent methyltransferase [Phenylobacterium sp.]|uniref:class I SAM-dependent methyltransferase n=1 Tax=Phenylobacterium sp. TaxID=1871053 RepID=UPI002C3A6780|nr:methyltransferase domain-containing protein [Phenylobacterium sp.]HLZ74625.1 methyltransferase domain-containing protein [Phenylobacterium sp.]